MYLSGKKSKIGFRSIFSAKLVATEEVVRARSFHFFGYKTTLSSNKLGLWHKPIRRTLLLLDEETVRLTFLKIYTRFRVLPPKVLRKVRPTGVLSAKIIYSSNYGRTYGLLAGKIEVFRARDVVDETPKCFIFVVANNIKTKIITVIDKSKFDFKILQDMHEWGKRKV